MSGTGPFDRERVEAALETPVGEPPRWAAARGAARRAQVRMFKSFVPEVLIFRGHPALPFLLVPPLVALCWERLPEHPRASVEAALVSAGAFALGVLGWTLLEYLMHRFLFHLPARGPAGRVVAFIVHGHHHRHPDETSRLAATPVQFASLGLLMWGVWGLTLGALWPAAMAGTMVGYLLYEAVHHLVHHAPRGGRVLEALRRHHMAHHHLDAGSRWGISSPLWDWVFRTL